MTDIIIELPLEAIDVGDRLRPVDEAMVLAIAASFAEQGQQAPIIVRGRGDKTDEVGLVAGLHRCHAARHLGWTTIKAIVKQLSDDEARLQEIDENLMRRELSQIDRSIFLAAREAAYLRLYPETAHGGKKGKSNQHVRKDAMLASFHSFAKDAAKKTGLSVRSIQRATALTADLAPETIAAIRPTPLADNGAALKKLAGIKDKAKQIAVAQALAAGEAKTLKEALSKFGLLPPAPDGKDAAVEDPFSKLYARSSATERRRWLLTILNGATTGERPALIKGLKKHLSLPVKLALRADLNAELDGYETASPADEEAA